MLNFNRAIIIAVALLLTGCGTLQKQAFDGTKTYALVTIACNDTVSVNSGNQNGGPASLLGLVQAADKDIGYSEKAAYVFKKVVPEIKTAFRQNGHFKLLSERRMLRSKVYRHMQGEKTDGFFIDYLLPKRYKLFQDKDQLKQLAKDLNVDGVITVTVNFHYGFGGVHLMGLVSAGYHKAFVDYHVAAIDREGNVLWSDNVEAKSDESVPALGDAVNFPKLRPLLVATGKKGVHDLLHKLDE